MGQNLKTEDVIEMLIESCTDVFKDQVGASSGKTITRLISHGNNNEIDVRTIRSSFGLTQDQFASAISMTPSTIKQWEQGIRSPKGTSRIVLEAMAIVAKKRRDKHNCKNLKDTKEIEEA